MNMGYDTQNQDDYIYLSDFLIPPGPEHDKLMERMKKKYEEELKKEKEKNKEKPSEE